MLQARPEIHGDGSDLNLHPHPLLPVGKEDGNLHDHVIAPVSILLRMADIVLDGDDMHVVLTGQHVGYGVDII